MGIDVFLYSWNALLYVLYGKLMKRVLRIRTIQQIITKRQEIKYVIGLTR